MLEHILAACLCAAAPSIAQDADASREPLEWKDGDRVALIGNTFVEREQRDGFIELALTLAAPQADVTFRNLGWSGDTVDGRARRFFGSTEKGFEHLLEHLDVVAPTIILVSYGTNAAFEGASGRTAFLEGYGRLLDELAKRTQRIVLVTSPPLDVATSPAPEVAATVNAELGWQAARLREVARERKLHFVDLFTPLERLNARGSAPGPLTDNGVHLTPLGYALAARIVLRELGLCEQAPADAEAADAQLAASATPLPAEHEQLRERVIEKNELFFHRHRPQNETYLRGFRKHEQGNNAVEIQAFAPLVAEKDREIFALRTALSGS